MNEINDKKITRIEWGIVFVAILLPLYSFLYIDTNSIIRCGIDVFKSIVEGGVKDYYDYAKASQTAGLMIHPPTYDFVFYLTVGIWEVPIALTELITGDTFQKSFLVLAYSKTLLFVFLLLCTVMVKKIAVELTVKEKYAQWAAFMFLTSGMVFSYLCIAGQYDIIGIFFSLVGVYFYLKKDMRKFGLLFAVAVQYKFFPLFIFLPLLLLRVKKIPQILGYLMLPIVSVMLFRLPFMNDMAIAEKNAINGEMAERILANRISILDTAIPLSFLLIGAVCIWCYFKEIDSEEQDRYYAIYIPFLSLGLLFCSFPFYPYWLLYITPWMPLLYFLRKDICDKKVLWIEAGMSVGIMWAQFLHFPWIFDLNNTNYMLLDVLYRRSYYFFTNPTSLNDVVKIVGDEGLLYGLYILCLITILVLYRPKKDMECRDEEFNARCILWVRFGVQYVVGALPFLLYIFNIVIDRVFY